MALAAAEKEHGELDPKLVEKVKAYSAATDNVGLFFGEDMSVAEIAVITGVPPGTVKSRLFAARKALREVFGEEHVKS